MASHNTQTIVTTVRDQFTGGSSSQACCRHCGATVSHSSAARLQEHLASCKSLPDSVRAVLDHAAACESRTGLDRYGSAHKSAYRGFRVTGWRVNECRRGGKVFRGTNHRDHRCRGTATQATVSVCGQFQNTTGRDCGDKSECRHCGSVVHKRHFKRHLARCASLPDSVRAVLDHAAVCESRAGLGCYGGVHESTYHSFRVIGWGVNECRRCATVVRGWGRELKRHRDRGCSCAVPWATVKVCGQFENTTGRDCEGRSKCRHCGSVVHKRHFKRHLAACKSLPESLRAVLDHAAVCESRAGMGCFGGVGAALYRSFRVIGLGVNECRRCGKVVRGWPDDLRRHLNRKSCVAGWTAEVAAQSAPRRFRANNRLSMSNAHVPDERATVAPDGAPTRSTRPTKRQRPDDSDTSNTCYGSDRDASASRPRQPCMRSKCGGGSLTSSTSSSALQPPRHQAFHEAGGTTGAAGATVWSHAQHAAFHGAVNRGVAWAHWYTVTWSGLKVPLAPLPFRCKRARILRQSGGPTTSSGRSVGDRCRSMGCGSEAKV